MPVKDKSRYPQNWKSEIRPAILARADNCCEFCGVPNYSVILRGTWNGIDCYQDENGTIFNASTSKPIGSAYVGEVHPTNTFIKVVLTIAHLNHNTSNNDYSNLRALCQRCHNRHDSGFRSANRKRKKKNQIPLF